ncbi:hypothetical protein BHE74_00042439 [Ensete ventricosum]|nr:hypothetical protein BHE74_00042439 [Ensete ventricosum]
MVACPAQPRAGRRTREKGEAAKAKSIGRILPELKEKSCISSMATAPLLRLVLVVSCIGSSMAVLFSGLPNTLTVTASPAAGQGLSPFCVLFLFTISFLGYDMAVCVHDSVLHAGLDQIKVSWKLNESTPASADSGYKKVKVLLCYAPVSQVDRGWRKTDDHLKKDKTCQFKVTTQPYSSGGGGSFVYSVERKIPTGTYFVRAYALDSGDTEVAYGQTTNAGKTANLFDVVGITGRHASLDVAAGCFSAFSILALVFFFVVEKRKAKK